jgi:hypothetical protein
MVTTSARGATGRRGTLRPCRSGLASLRTLRSPRLDCAASRRVEASNPASRPTFPAWRNWLTRPSQKRLNASALRAENMWVRIPPPGPFWRDARPLGWPLRCQRRDRRVRIPCVPPQWARRGFDSLRVHHSNWSRQSSVAEGRDGDLGGLISLEMRVRFPPPLPQPVRSKEGRRSYKPLMGVRFPHRLPRSSMTRREGLPSRVAVV